MYELHRLGWNSFQQLCQTICREVLGQTVESFLDSNDAGKDGAFAGTWIPAQGEVYAGRFVIQCKFTADVGHNLKPSDIKDEFEKVRKLVAAGQCDVYVLMTNAGVSGAQTTKVKTLLTQAGVKHVLVFGATWINQQIREKKNLRMHVPRMYGLGDLSQIPRTRRVVRPAPAARGLAALPGRAAWPKLQMRVPGRHGSRSGGPLTSRSEVTRTPNGSDAAAGVAPVQPAAA